jgi:hypothetical protein
MSNEDWSERELDEGRPGDRAVDREVERLKSVYRQHADALAKLAASSPTKMLARKYSDLIGDINRSILSLEDPETAASRKTYEQPVEPSPAQPPPVHSARRSVSDVQLRTEPGRYVPGAEPAPSAIGRIALILGMAIVVISLLAFFVWKFAGEPRTEHRVDEVTSDVTEPATSPVTAPLPELRVAPEAQDYGVVYRGTRVAKSFDVSNTSDRDITIEVERSDCRCLWFDYPKLVPAGGSVSLTVAVDAGLAEPGLLSEAVVISMNEPPRQTAEVLVTAEIR